MREYVRKLLSPSCDVEAVPDGEAALEVIRQRPPDLVLTDVMMPKLDGFGLLKELRSDERTETIPVIMLSARAGEESRVEGLSAGADDYLNKPFSARELLARVNSHLKMARTRQEVAQVERKLRAEAEKREHQFREMIDVLPAAIYTTDAKGRLTHFNRAAVEFSGREPHLGSDQWCVSWKLYRPDGTPLPHDECPMAVALKEGRVISGAEAIAERPDGSRRWFTPYPTPLRNSEGGIIGGINMLVDITERKGAENALADALRQQRALFQVADGLHRASSLDEIYGTAMEAICDALQCERVAILLFDETGTMRFVSWRGLSENYREAVEGHSPWKRDDPDPQPICVPDISTAQLDEGLKNTILAEGIHACAFIPLLSDGKLVGKFMMYFNSARSFADTELQLSLTIARQIAFAISRRGAEEASRESEERFRRLAETLDGEVHARTEELEQRNLEVLTQAEQVRQLSWQILRTQDEERRHIARELHDSAGQTLAVLGINVATIIENARKQAPDVVAAAEQTREVLEELTKEIRTTSYLLHPPLLDENGLPAALSWYIRGLSERSGLDIEFGISEEFGRLTREMELVVFRLVQECLTNIHRHSGSKRAIIQINRDVDRVLIEVRDQGKGIPKEKLAQIRYGRAGVGIRGMRERLRQFQGEMSLDSTAAGTTVIVTLPVSREIASSNANEKPLESAV